MTKQTEVTPEERQKLILAGVGPVQGTSGGQTTQAEVSTQYVRLSKGLLERVCAEFRKVPEVKRYLAKHPDVNVSYFASFVVRDEEGNDIIAWEEADSD